jgi:7-cyano-7-deazaguanine tRNA-ribosyltransferase
MRAHGHPALLSALKKLLNHADLIENYSPSMKTSGLFYFDSEGLARPEITHYRMRLTKQYEPPRNAKALFLVPQTRNKPFHKAPEFKKIRQLFRSLGEDLTSKIHVCVYCAPFGVVPLELDEIYPLSQHEAAMPIDLETMDYVANQTQAYIRRSTYLSVIMLNDAKNWQNKVEKSCKSACRAKGLSFDCVGVDAKGSKEILACLEKIFRKHLGE